MTTKRDGRGSQKRRNIGVSMMPGMTLLVEAAKRGLAPPLSSAPAPADLASGALEEVMSEWSTQFPGFFLYYPRAAAARQMPLKLRVFIDALRARMK